MPDATHFLQSLTLVLCVAAITSVVFQRFRLPPVLGYLLAGLLIGPNVPVPLVADVPTVRTLSELGVILLMFYLGLEFKLHRLARLASTAGLVGALEMCLMLILGYSVGQLLGWSTLESVFAGAIVAISSTVIIVKSFESRRIGGRLADLVYSVLIVEDLGAILLIAALTTVATGAEFSAAAAGITIARLGGFLLVTLGAGLLVVPRLFRAILRLRSPETTLVASIGLSFAAATGAHAMGYSVALGAFLAGSIVAESGASRQVADLIRPVRDMFAAIFFVAVGMLLDPAEVWANWPAVVALTAVVLIGKPLGITVGAFLTGHGTRTSVRAGLSMAQIGEFSFIIAGLGLTNAAVGGMIYPVAVAVSVLTAVTTTWLVGHSGAVADLVERRLPNSLQTFSTLYGTWLETLRLGPAEATPWRQVRRLIRFVLIDAVVLGAIVIGGSLGLAPALGVVERYTGYSGPLARVAVLVATAAAALPFVVGIVRTARGLGATLAAIVLPAVERGKVDTGAAPRRALEGTLQIGVVLIVGAPLVAVTLPFLPRFQGPLLLALLLLLLGVAFWRSAANLQGHMRAGAAVVVEVLARQTSGVERASLDEVRDLLPGIGELTPVSLAEGNPAVGRTLAELNVRGLTGASVVALCRGQERLVLPTPDEVLQAGDLLALTGSHAAIEAGRNLLLSGLAPSGDSA